jgi:hypothetical protein
LLIEWHGRYFLPTLIVPSLPITMMRMKKGTLLFSLLLWCFAATASAQIRKEIEKAKKDPQTDERAAKGDASLVDLRKVPDARQSNENGIRKSSGSPCSEKKGKKKRSR